MRTVADAPAGFQVEGAVLRLLGWGEGVVGLLERGGGPRGDVRFVEGGVYGHDLSRGGLKSGVGE